MFGSYASKSSTIRVHRGYPFERFVHPPVVMIGYRRHSIRRSEKLVSPKRHYECGQILAIQIQRALMVPFLGVEGCEESRFILIEIRDYLRRRVQRIRLSNGVLVQLLEVDA